MAKALTLKAKAIIAGRIDACREQLLALIALLDASPAWADGDAWVYSNLDQALGSVDAAARELKAGRPR